MTTAAVVCSIARCAPRADLCLQLALQDTTQDFEETMTDCADRLRGGPASRAFRAYTLLAGTSWLLASAACTHPADEGAALEQSGPPDPGEPLPGEDAGPPPVALTALPPVCSTAGWCWATQGLQGNTLRAVAASSATDVWAVGSLGLALHLEGTTWSAHWAPTEKVLRGVWRNAGDVWAVGDDSTVLHYISEH
jgi:hypothetical protein